MIATLSFLAFALEYAPAAQHQIAPLRIRLSDHAHQLLVDVIREVINAVNADLARRNKSADLVDHAFEPAGVRPGYAALDQRTDSNIGPVADIDRSARNRDLVQVIVRVVTGDEHVHRRADFRRFGKCAE